MNKSELIDLLASKSGTTKTDAAKVLDAFTQSVTETLAGGDSITLIGFGTFSVSERSARDGRNPQTGETIKIKASKVAKFKAGKAVSEALNVKPKKKTKK
ncbi:HU family DNA-binding protein [Rhizosphaericola mali]|uniref:HU family DNA-binding protein n=1 Tax=Rhizosphaericola mali TaxID=2545455 RepID=A0A5P2G4N4_9BACT|nr:HU family DNA-binding protein [Rhizosphaericola mali]QES88053.1 HU family DNA-binding protein [Rhizosphaericola mali]QES88772.1 HU family DNA-binding protein [Rhizosphaericola mali]